MATVDCANSWCVQVINNNIWINKEVFTDEFLIEFYTYEGVTLLLIAMWLFIKKLLKIKF